MPSRYQPKALICLAILLFSLALKAQPFVGTHNKLALPDSTAGLMLAVNHSPAVLPVLAPADAATVHYSNAAEQRRLLKYLKQLNITDAAQEYQSHKKFYYHLANVFARLRLYPLAMKCFLKTIPADTVRSADNLAGDDTTGLNSGYLNVSALDDEQVAEQTTRVNQPAATSKHISYQNIASRFNDCKPAVGYALLFHVKQPVPGKRKIFAGTNTGHTFITLIKYNADSTYVSASFGFYPKKDQLFSATPLAPNTSATFKDDAARQWDEVMGKFISKRKFEKILKLTKDFDGMDYNLNNNNCTDFGLKAAAVAGISIYDTAGKWPLGSGNNPAVTGQSMLQNKFNDDADKAKVLNAKNF